MQLGNEESKWRLCPFPNGMMMKGFYVMGANNIILWAKTASKSIVRDAINFIIVVLRERVKALIAKK